MTTLNTKRWPNPVEDNSYDIWDLHSFKGLTPPYDFMSPYPIVIFFYPITPGVHPYTQCIKGACL